MVQGVRLIRCVRRWGVRHEEGDKKRKGRWEGEREGKREVHVAAAAFR